MSEEVKPEAKKKIAIPPEKLKVLQAAMDKLEKDFGKGTIMRMSDRPVEDVAVIPSGSIAIDVALGVG
ncbi:MAG: DNA recombination/repair protein RecA, partial [Mucinivorans sp.]